VAFFLVFGNLTFLRSDWISASLRSSGENPRVEVRVVHADDILSIKPPSAHMLFKKINKRRVDYESIPASVAHFTIWAIFTHLAIRIF
jgi:hypothetical protein